VLAVTTYFRRDGGGYYGRVRTPATPPPRSSNNRQIIVLSKGLRNGRHRPRSPRTRQRSELTQNDNRQRIIPKSYPGTRLCNGKFPSIVRFFSVVRVVRRVFVDVALYNRTIGSIGLPRRIPITARNNNKKNVTTYARRAYYKWSTRSVRAEFSSWRWT